MRFILLIVLLTATACNRTSEAVQYGSGTSEQAFWMPLEEAMQLSANEQKYVLIDVYTEWCGFCRRMIAETYADSRVHDALDSFFLPVRLNAESNEEITFLGNTYTKSELALQLGVRSYPTTIFLNAEGEPVAAQPGFVEPSRFHHMLSYIGSERFLTQSFSEYMQSR